MPIYEIEAPDGRILEIEGDQFPSEAELNDIFASTQQVQGKGTKAEPFQAGISKNIDLRPSGLARTAAKYAVGVPTSVVESLVTRKPFGEVFNKNQELFKQVDELPAVKRGDTALDIGTAFMLPEVKAVQGIRGANAINRALTGGYQGGLIGGAESLANEGDLSGVVPGAVGGTVLNTGLPVVGNLAEKSTKLLPMAGGWVGRTFGRIQPETLQRAVQADSKALDISPNQAQNMLSNVTERVRTGYDNLLKKRGEAISKAEENLRNIPERIKVKDVLRDIRNTFNQYNGDEVNVARNLTGDLEDELYTMVNNAGKQVDQIPVKQAPNPDLIAEQELLNEYNLLKNDLIKKYGSLDNLKAITKKDIKQNARWGERFDSLDDYRNILSYEQLLQNAKYVDNRIPSIVTGELLGNGNLGAIPKPQIPTNTPSTISPIDLQKLKQQVGQMTNWADTTRPKIQNTILEQVYGDFNNRLMNLSPELAAANKSYAQLKNFQNNEGLKRILRPGDNIDSASTALKNYNNTVTKGNTNRNIQDLENVLVADGQKPFLNEIDDINAAMDLNNIRGTGDSFYANLGTALARPVLKGVRELNRRGLPQAYERLKRALPQNFVPYVYGIKELIDRD